jgi:hypothetical protein
VFTESVPGNASDVKAAGAVAGAPEGAKPGAGPGGGRPSWPCSLRETRVFAVPRPAKRPRVDKKSKQWDQPRLVRCCSISPRAIAERPLVPEETKVHKLSRHVFSSFRHTKAQRWIRNWAVVNGVRLVHVRHRDLTIRRPRLNRLVETDEVARLSVQSLSIQLSERMNR